MPRPTALALSAALTLVGVTTTACGRSEDPADRVRATLHDFSVALADGDGKRACALFTDRARRAYEEDEYFGSCVDTFSFPGLLLPEAEKRAMRNVTVDKVAIDGDRATVRDEDVDLPAAYAAIDDGKPTVLRRVPGGNWKIESIG